jgi:alcohol dehydrogenase class IV
LIIGFGGGSSMDVWLVALLAGASGATSNWQLYGVGNARPTVCR